MFVQEGIAFARRPAFSRNPVALRLMEEGDDGSGTAPVDKQERLYPEWHRGVAGLRRKKLVLMTNEQVVSQGVFRPSFLDDAWAVQPDTEPAVILNKHPRREPYRFTNNPFSIKHQHKHRANLPTLLIFSLTQFLRHSCCYLGPDTQSRALHT